MLYSCTHVATVGIKGLRQHSYVGHSLHWVSNEFITPKTDNLHMDEAKQGRKITYVVHKIPLPLLSVLLVFVSAALSVSVSFVIIDYDK